MEEPKLLVSYGKVFLKAQYWDHFFIPCSPSLKNGFNILRRGFAKLDWTSVKEGLVNRTLVRKLKKTLF